MKINPDIRDLQVGRYQILILSKQFFCKKIRYTENHTDAMALAHKYEAVGCICITSRILNNTLNQQDKRTYNG